MHDLYYQVRSGKVDAKHELILLSGEGTEHPLAVAYLSMLYYDGAGTNTPLLRFVLHGRFI